MVVNSTIEKLISLGFSEYEARAYFELVRNNPATAYEIARSSGIPTSKIYEVLARLAEKGVVLITGSEDRKRYIPVPVNEFIESRKRKMSTLLDSIRDDLSALNGESDVSYLWNIKEYDYLIEKASRMITEAQTTLLVSGWRDEIEKLAGILHEKDKEGVRIATVYFGGSEPDLRAGQVFQHPIEDTIYNERGGRGLVIIADDTVALMGTVLPEGRCEGAWSMNSGFITLAADYIKHDIYIMKIVRRFDDLLIRHFGQNYFKLRDVFHDEEVTE